MVRRWVARCAGSEGTSVGLVDVGHVQPQADARDDLGLPVRCAGMLADLQQGVAELELGVTDASARLAVPLDLGRFEDICVERDGRVGIFDDQIGPYCPKPEGLIGRPRILRHPTPRQLADPASSCRTNPSTAHGGGTYDPRSVMAALTVVIAAGACTSGRTVSAPTTVGQTSLTSRAASTTPAPPSTTTTLHECVPPPPAPQTVAADMDGDGHPDLVTFTAVGMPGDSCFVVTPPAWRIDAVLASGATLQTTIDPTLLQADNGKVVLGVVRLGAGHSQQLLLHGLGNDSVPIEILSLSGKTLVLAEPHGGDTTELQYSVFGHGCCLGWTGDLICPVVAGTPAVEQTFSMVEPAAEGPNAVDPTKVYALETTDPAALRRYWQRTIYRLDGSRLVPIVNDSGSTAFGTPAPPAIPLSNELACQGITSS